VATRLRAETRAVFPGTPGRLYRAGVIGTRAHVLVTLTMRFGDDVREVPAGSVARVPPETIRSHRNLGDEPVELWAVSRKIEESDSEKVDDFWEASPEARQTPE
jgi:hypothetical protein